MNKLSWYFNRLSLMSPLEIGNRLIDEAKKNYENVFFRDFVPNTDLNNTEVNWYFKREDRTKLFRYLVKNGLWNESEACELLKHNFSFFSLDKAFLGEEISWHTDYKNSVQSPVTYSKRIDYRDYDVVGDFKYIWEINRHQHLITLAKAYYLTGNEKYRDEVEQQITSWIDQNPYMTGINWTSSLELAVRLISWAWVWFFLGDIEKSLKEKWLECVYKHCLFISKNISKFSSANNHLIGEVSGLFIASIVWPFEKTSEKWRDQTYQVLVREMEKQNYEDGVNKEQAISYQQFILDFFILAGLLGQKNGISFPKAYWERTEHMLIYIASVMDKNGNVPRIGDADDGYAVILSENTNFNAFKSLLVTGALLYKKGEFKAQSEEIDEKSLWLFGLSGLDEFDQLQTRKVQLKKDFRLGGYYVLGTDSGAEKEVKSVFDCGRLGYLSIAAHGHADALSFSLSIDGNEILVDPGTYIYQDPKEWRDYFRGTSAHNTIRVDGIDQSEIGGNFMWLTKAKSRLIEWDSNQIFDHVVAEHDGYERLRDPVIHRRDLFFDKNENRFKMEDFLVTQGSHEIEWFFHFSFRCKVERIDDNSWIITNHGSRVLLNLDPGLEYELFRGSTKPIIGWESYSFDRKTATSTLRGVARIHGTTSFESELVVI